MGKKQIRQVRQQVRRFYDGGVPPRGADPGSAPDAGDDPRIVLDRHSENGVEQFALQRRIAYLDRHLGELLVPADPDLARLAKSFNEGLALVQSDEAALNSVDQRLFFIQWVAPFLSEFPEKVSAFLWARRVTHAPMALMNMVSSNINQWTLLAGTGSGFVVNSAGTTLTSAGAALALFCVTAVGAQARSSAFMTPR